MTNIDALEHVTFTGYDPDRNALFRLATTPEAAQFEDRPFRIVSRTREDCERQQRLAQQRGWACPETDAALKWWPAASESKPQLSAEPQQLAVVGEVLSGWRAFMPRGLFLRRGAPT